MRELSHRRTAAAIADYIEKSTDLPLWPCAVEVSDALVLRRLLEDLPLAVVKQPWSSSGRGVRYFDAARTSVDTFVGQTVGTIARQGSVMVERFMPEHHDFALLFQCNHGKVEYVGPSVFISGSAAANYGGNIVAPDSHLRALISEFIDPVQFDELTSAVASAIEAVIAPAYDGPVGVDICASGGLIHICETNLRYTMGFVARGIATHSDIEGILTSTDRPDENDIVLTPPGVATKFVVRH